MTNHPNRNRIKNFTVSVTLAYGLELHQALEAITEEVWARGYTPGRREKLNIQRAPNRVTSINFTVVED